MGVGVRAANPGQTNSDSPVSFIGAWYESSSTMDLGLQGRQHFVNRVKFGRDSTVADVIQAFGERRVNPAALGRSRMKLTMPPDTLNGSRSPALKPARRACPWRAGFRAAGKAEVIQHSLNFASSACVLLDHMNNAKRSAADVLTGFAALVLFILADSLIHVAADLRVGVLVVAALYFCSGLTRGKTGPASTWLKGLVVSSVGCASLCLIVWNGVPHTTLAVLTIVSILFAICGVYVRRLPRARALWLALVAFSSVAVIVETGLPLLTTRAAVRRTMTAPARFSLEGLDGKQVLSSDLLGRVVVLDFWATWCPSCRRELPEINKLYQRYQSSPQVVFLAVDVNTGGETPIKASTFMKHNGYMVPVAFDRGNTSDRLLNDSGFPALVILDKSGRIRLIHSGYDESERLVPTLSEEIDALIREP